MAGRQGKRLLVAVSLATRRGERLTAWRWGVGGSVPEQGALELSTPEVLKLYGCRNPNVPGQEGALEPSQPLACISK